MREILRRFGFLFRRAEYERDLTEEMAHHLAMIEADKGSNPAARKQFGNITSLKEESRSMWTFGFLEQLAQDVRYAMRAMASNPLFTATAALSWRSESARTQRSTALWTRFCCVPCR